MTILSKACKPDNFELHNSLKLSFTNIRGLRSNFVDCESFFESNSPDILALCETNLDDSIDSGNFSMRGYLPLIWKDSSTHIHGLAVYVKEGLPFARDLSLVNSADSYLCFRLALLHSVSYFFFLYRSPSSALCTVFDSVSSNIDEVLSINPSASVFVFGDVNVHHKDWLTYSSGTDRPGELCYNFSISNDLTQMVDFPTRIADCDSHNPALLDLFLSSDASIKNVGERSTAKNYRTVSLLSVVSKVFEKLVNNRIVDHLEKCGLFSDFEYGFRSSRSTADLLTVVSDRIARAFNRSGATRAVALDISKAFDRVWHAGLFHKLKSYGISSKIFSLISSFLSNRRLRVVLDGKSSQEYPVNAGVPQGSILGPTLFLLYINDLPDDVICDIAIYADDTTLYSRCDRASDLWQQLELASEFESDLRDTVNWGKKWLVDFNAGKTQLVSFDRSNNNGSIDVKMGGSSLEEKSSFKMLGLTFSSKLDWGSYIISIAKTASKKIGALIRSMKFLSPEGALYLYKSTIRPCMEYCCHVWAGAPSCYLDLLDKL